MQIGNSICKNLAYFIMISFLKKFFTYLLAIWISVVFGTLILICLLIGLLYGLSSGHLPIKDQSVLVIDLGKSIADSPESSGSTSWLHWAESSPWHDFYLHEVLKAIERAQKDDKIIGIMLKGARFGHSTSIGLAQLGEIREALENFKVNSTKPIIAHLESSGVREYYLASVANKISIDPIGELIFNGMCIENAYYGDALKKFGIGVQVTKVGEYKSAVEPFTRSDMSPEDRQQVTELLSGMWNDLIAVVSKARKIETPQLQILSNTHGLFLAHDALEFGLIDKMEFYDEAFEQFKKNKDETINKVALKNYIENDVTFSEHHDKIAIVYVEGSIVNGEGHSYEAGGDRLAKKIQKLKDDEAVKGIVLRVNTPGGSATGAEKIQREVRSYMETKKPVVVSMGNYAASGGYWVSAYSDKILANPLTITGSIGVFGLLYNVDDLATKIGVNFNKVLTGELADLELLIHKKSDKAMDILQRSTQFFYNLFIQKVSEGRHLTEDKVKAIANGRVWSGENALKNSLIDEYGGLLAAINHVQTLAKLEANAYSIEHVPSREDFTWESIQKWMDPNEDTSVLAKITKQIKSSAAWAFQLNDPRGVYTLWPYKLE